ncbi:hypothetical protein OCS_01280 [Ophiocordyceps sinensis CO18]|uniref:Uncharacterized protein n=1 Tax=Ophiocordyceps sinensis (strain Co18 / CGMCC 3.14243) TaxID=911162 RepID=T5AMM8_OPHSC|nr:hypothetical protein OCS_01280 [Ophiocordyceps sinensis CO18]
MAPASYFGTVTSPSSFRARLADKRAQTLSELDPLPASQWARDHLLACRVVRRDTQSNVLPILSPYSEPTDTHGPLEIQGFVNGPTPAQLAQHERLLAHSCGFSLGQVRASMARLTGPQERRALDYEAVPSPEDGGDEPRPKRAAQGTRQDDFTNSTTMRVGSSSPLTESSQEPSSMDHVDTESHTLLSAPEEWTSRLVSCAIRHILQFASAQDFIATVEFRDNKARLASFLPGPTQKRVVAIDDGGLCLRVEKSGVFQVVKNRVAILETKKRFQCFEGGRPTISDECFAQMTSEALVARLVDPLDELTERYHSSPLY